MKKILKLLVLKSLIGLFVSPAWAVPIEGLNRKTFTMQTYSVTADGSMPVIVGSTSPFIVSFGTATTLVFQGNPPWQVAVSSLNAVATGQTTVNPGAAVPCYPAESRFRQGVLYNTTDRDAVGALTVWIGSSTVTPANGFPLKAGAAYGPDDPYYFSGTIFCSSTATAASTAYIYHYKP